jgi:hypothetical protein
METGSTREDATRQTQETIGEIARRLNEALAPTLVQILREHRHSQVPVTTTLLGVVAFAASEVAIGAQLMIRGGADQDKLIDFCSNKFKEWMLDCIEQDIAGNLN